MRSSSILTISRILLAFRHRCTRISKIVTARVKSCFSLAKRVSGVALLARKVRLTGLPLRRWSLGPAWRSTRKSEPQRRSCRQIRARTPVLRRRPVP